MVKLHLVNRSITAFAELVSCIETVCCILNRVDAKPCQVVLFSNKLNVLYFPCVNGLSFSAGIFTISIQKWRNQIETSANWFFTVCIFCFWDEEKGRRWTKPAKMHLWRRLRHHKIIVARIAAAIELTRMIIASLLFFPPKIKTQASNYSLLFYS